MKRINSCKNPAGAESSLILHGSYDSFSALSESVEQLRGISRCEQSFDKGEYPERAGDDFSSSLILQPSWRRTFAGFVRVARSV